MKPLIAIGATVIAVEHGLDVIRNADHIIDMGSCGGAASIFPGRPEH